ncbi:OmpA family protein [Pseudodesulfovibrio sp. zrk46]|uniref:OmpA family protein n=1 Tax=Pseudodesulfovibrio sp. zrk46 TaxID=2725288 RepID=UPI001FFC91F6|nr:OmpA family protein [Pseudodesulfovibrio sp. zrk46]
MSKIAIACIVSLMLSVVWIFPATANEDIVQSEELIQQLKKQPQTRKTRGFVISGAETGPAPQQAAPPSATIYVYFISGTVDFADEQSRQQLDELGRALTSKALTGARFEISGHTDSVGSDEYNMNLSRRRAETVNAYLEENFGYSTTAVEGYGETQPIATNDTSEGRARNRRVVITRLD